MPRRKYGASFSWKRALGISGAKARFSRATGIPLTRSGRERKLGRNGGGLFIGFILGILVRGCVDKSATPEQPDVSPTIRGEVQPK